MEQLRKCSRCKEREAKPKQRYCKECHAEYMRGWRSAFKRVATDAEILEWGMKEAAKRNERGRAKK